MSTLARRTGDEASDGLASDDDLLARVVYQDDEAAFAVLVARYCGLVLGVCRRVLRNEHDAEDAFQATFLVLARRAARIHHRGALASWLYAVAYRTALRANQQRRQRRQEPLGDDLAALDDVLQEINRRYEQQLLDEELNRLPSHYRDPLVLRYLLGKSNRQIAMELGVTTGVVEGRLKRGKDSLRLRLAKRGLVLSTALAAFGIPHHASAAAIHGPLVAATADAATAFRCGLEPEGSFSPNAIQFAEKELAMSTSGSVTITSGVAVAILLSGLALAGTGIGGQPPAGTPAPELATTIPAETVPSSPEPALLAMAPGKPEKEKDPFGAKGGGRSKAVSLREKDASDAGPKLLPEPKLEAELKKSTQLEFVETPLQDVFEFLKDYHGIEIQIDRKALDDVGIGSDTPVTRNLNGISLRTGLRLILRDLDLTYTTMDEVLLITTPEAVAKIPVTRSYPVGDLVGTSPTASGDKSWLATAILHLRPQGEIAADAITQAQVGGQPVLIFSGAYTVHEDIERLLSDLRRVADKPKEAPQAGGRPK
jgi:RNA polymerase sigma factor (sigma-70 family)